MKGKLKFHVALVLAFVFAFVGILTLTVNKVSAVSAEDTSEAKHIDFTPVANYTKNYDENNDGVNDALLIDPDNYSTTTSFTVSYNVTYNDGINSILLLPQFNTEVFSISAIDVKETVLGSATITNEGFDKILLESKNFYNAVSTENATEALITITFNIDNPVNGDYKFGLKLELDDNEELNHNNLSEAYYWLEGTKLGEQEQVEIRLVETDNTVKIRTLLDAEIEIGYNSPEEEELEYAFIYAKQPVAVQKVEEFSEESTNLVAEYTYTGTATPVIKWYTITDYNGNEPVYTEYSQQYNLDTLIVPQTVGTYYVGISAPAHGVYRAVAEEIRRVIITPAPITITIGNETSAYGDPIVSPLTAYTVTAGTVYTGDDLLLSQFNTEATSTSPVGEYDITCSTMYTNPNYLIDIVNGKYTITPRAVTITAVDQHATYTGTEPSVDQTKYTFSGVETLNGTVVITKAPGVYVGEYTLTPSIESNNYTVTAVNGKFYIESAGNDIAFIKSFFAGKTVVYNAQEQDLLLVKDVNANDVARPAWMNNYYTDSTNLKTNVGEYTITVRYDFDIQSAVGYLDAETVHDNQYYDENAGVNKVRILFTVNGEITPAELEIAAVDKGHVYGNTPATLTPATVNGVGDEVVNVTFTVKNGDEVIILSTETPVGQYTIIPSGDNENYTYTYHNGTYTVSKATANIEVSAEDVFYNRNLDYDISVSANSVEVNTYEILIIDENNNEYTPYELLENNTVLNAGTYTIKVIVPDTDNYNGATQTKTFEVKKIDLETPTLTYDATKATWTAVTKDAQGKNLYNSTITYEVNETVVDGLSYTVNSKDELTLYVTSSNDNYNGVDVVLEITVYAVTFEDGSHPATQGEPENMPAAQYIISGGLATQPSNPIIYGYTFQYWNDGIMSNNQFDFTTPITADKTLKAVWSANYYTVRFKISDDDAEPVEQDVVYNGKISFVPADPEKVSDNAGITYTFNGWYAEDVAYRKGNLYLANVETDEDYIVTKAVTFVAHYTENFVSFKVSYKVSTDNGAYEVFGQEQEVTYNQPITYATLTNNVIWFKAESWFANEARTEVAPTLMPNHNITVYGAIVFDIGSGDVNGNGEVNVGDITLYRQWIVGGYDMTVVAAGQEYATASAANFDSSKRYYLARVADINLDNSKDIRDVSITRMSIVGGYTWDNENAYNVSGNEIIRNVQATTLSEIIEAVNAGKKVTVVNDITADNAALNITNYNGNISINLNGHKLTVESFNVASNGVNKTVSVVNGTIVTTQGITIACPKGNVVLQNLTGYVNDSVVNLQAASSSLHIKENVAFYKNQYDENEPEIAEIPAVVNIADKTHIVVEPQATLIVEKLVVEQNAEISITVNSAETAIIAVEGTVEVKNNVAETKVYAEDNALLALVKAAKEGGEFTLEQDYEISEPIIVEADLVLNLNGYNIYNTKDIWDKPKAAWSLISVRGGNLTINGNGELEAKANDCYALDVQDDGTIIINGGKYTGNISAVYAHSGVVTINGGEFEIIQLSDYNDQRYLLNCLDAMYNIKSNFIVKGGSFHSFNPDNNASEGTATSYLAQNFYAKATQVNNETVYQVVTDGVTNEQELRDALTNKARTIRVLNDISSINGYLVENNTSINLGGNTITVTSGSNVTSRAFKVDNGATLSVENGTVDAKGTKDTGCFGAFRAEVGTTLNLTNLTLKNYRKNGLNVKVLGATATLENVTITSVWGGGIEVTNDGGANGTVTGYAVLRNCVMTQSDYYDWCSTAVSVSGNSTLDVYSTSYTGEYGLYVFSSGGTINVYGGEFTATGHNVIQTTYGANYGNDAIVNIYGGTFTGTFGIGNSGHEFLNIYGGTFNNDPTAYVADKHYVEENNGVYTVKEYTTVSTVAEIAAVRTVGGFYQLGADIIYGGQLSFTADTTINLNGYKLQSVNDSALSSANGATLTIEGNGNVEAQEVCVLVLDGSKAVINGGEYTSHDNFVVGTNGSTGRGNNTITINAGTFNGNITTAGYVACGIYVANSDTVTVNGGTFNITNGVGILARSGNTTVAENVVFNVTGNGAFGKVGDSKVTVPAGEELVLDLAANYPGGTPALTNNTNYTVYTKDVIANITDLNKAIQNGGDYTLTANVIYNGQAGFAHDTVINLNGYKLQSLNDSALSVANGATLTINGNGNVEAQEVCVLVVDGSKAIINGGVYTSHDNFVVGTNGSTGRGNNTITINDGTFNGNITSAGYVACGIYVANSDTVTVNGGTFNITNGVGILARSGNTTVANGVVFNVTGNGENGKVGDSRVVIPSGEELVLDLAAKYPGGTPVLTNNNLATIYTVE